jgi:hypothetical protein
MSDKKKGVGDTFKQARDWPNIIIFYIDQSADPNVPDNWKRTTQNDIVAGGHANPMEFLEKNNARMPTGDEMFGIKNAPWRSEVSAGQADLSRLYWSPTGTPDGGDGTQRVTDSGHDMHGYRSAPVKPRP